MGMFFFQRSSVCLMQPEQISRYRLRRSRRGDHFCTAEVAALCLELAGEAHAAQVLDAYLDVFSHCYLQAKHQLAVDSDDALHRRLRDVIALAGAAGAQTATPRWGEAA